MVDLKKVVKEHAIDLWVIRYFKVLPTDQRFKDLSEKQKLLLLVSFFESPLDEWAYLAHQKSKQVTTAMNDETVENLKNIGYTKEQIARMMNQLQAAAEANNE
jgi:hypothetical protein